MYKVLFTIFIFILLALFFPKSEAFAVCNYCPAGTERDDSCLLDNGTPQERAVEKTPGCAGTKVPNVGDPLSDSCQCVDPPTAAPAAPAPIVPAVAAQAPAAATKCAQTTEKVCSNGTKPGTNGTCAGSAGAPSLPETKTVWNCNANPGTGPSKQDASCECRAGLPAAPAGAGAAAGTRDAAADAAAAAAVCSGGNCTGGKGLQCDIGSGAIATNGKGNGIMTAIGCVPSEPRTLINRVLQYGTVASGVVAFLIMILAALQMITAEGNPQSIKAAQEKFYSAIIGLLFIIFAVLMLQVIGVDLLGLKAFTR